VEIVGKKMKKINRMEEFEIWTISLLSMDLQKVVKKAVET
jgi:hypothetical protein